MSLAKELFDKHSMCGARGDDDVIFYETFVPIFNDIIERCAKEADDCCENVGAKCGDRIRTIKAEA